jgi:hypothetical protein
VFLFHKYVLIQACVGVFPTSEVDYVVGGLCAALNERASGLELSTERQQAMEQMWQQRTAQFTRPFSQDRIEFVEEGSGPIHCKQTIVRFCQNVREIDNPPDIWVRGRWPIPRSKPLHYRSL